MYLLILHQDKLNDFALDLANHDASHLENVQSTALVQNRLAHVVEGPIIKHDVRDVKLPDRARVAQNTPNGRAMHLLVKVHVLEAQLEQLLVELHALSDLFEVYNVLERDLEEADRFNERFGLEPLAEDGSGLACELALLEAQVDDTGLQIHKRER